MVHRGLELVVPFMNVKSCLWQRMGALRRIVRQLKIFGFYVVQHLPTLAPTPLFKICTSVVLCAPITSSPSPLPITLMPPLELQAHITELGAPITSSILGFIKVDSNTMVAVILWDPTGHHLSNILGKVLHGLQSK